MDSALGVSNITQEHAVFMYYYIVQTPHASRRTGTLPLARPGQANKPAMYMMCVQGKETKG